MFTLPAVLAKILTGILIADSVWLLCGGSGIFIGDSHDTLIMAVFLPTIFFHWRILAVLPLISILAIPGFSAKAVLFLHLALSYPVLWLFAPIPLIYYPQDINHQRLEFWAPYTDWWLQHANPLIGTGPGSFEWVAWSIGHPRMWLHNDWLQLFFEFGIAGGAMFVFAYLMLLLRVRGRALRVLIALGFAMAMYSPLQFFITQFLIMSEIIISTERKP